MKVKLLDLRKNRLFSGEKMRKNSLAESGRFFCDLYCFEPGQEQKIHRHDDTDKVYIVLEGRGTFRVGDEEHNLVPDEGVLAAAHQDHGVRNQTDQRLVLLVFMAPRP